MRISEVSDQSGVPAKTIRFWEGRHLLPEPARTSAGYRDYDPAVLERLAFIRTAQTAGLTLSAISQDARTTPRDLLARKLTAITNSDKSP